jgi:trigger factor
MQYEVESKQLTTIRRRLEFSVPGAAMKAELKVEFDKLRQTVRLRGFRPGKVPASVVKKRFGNQVRSDVAERVVNQIWREAVGTIEVAGQPTLVDRGDVEGGDDFAFVIEVDVRPEVTLGEYKGVEVEYVRREAEESGVDQMVQVKLASLRRIQEVEEDRAVAEGDFVLTGLTLHEGDEELIEEPGTLINTAAERFYPGLESLLIGLKKGEEKTGEVTIGENSVLDQVKGRTVTAKVKIEAIQSYQTPELSDAVAEELGYEGGLDAMRSAIRMELDERIDASAREAAQVKLLQILVNAHEFDVPEAMIDEQYEALVEEHKIRRAYAGEDMRTITIDEATTADLRSRARFAAKASVLLLQISKAEALEVNSDDLEAKIAEIASQRNQTPQAIRGYLERENAMPVLQTRVTEEKVIAWLMENADLKAVAPEAVATEEAAPKAKAKAKAKPKAKAKAKAVEPTPAVEEAASAGQDYDSMKVAELKALCKERGIKGYSKLKRAGLVEALQSAE